MNKAKFFPNNIFQVVLLLGLFLFFGALIMGFIELVFGFNKIVKTNDDIPIFFAPVLIIYIVIIHLRNRLCGIYFNYGFNFRYKDVILKLIFIIFLIQFGVIGLLSILCSNNQISNPFNANILNLFSILIFAPVIEEFLFRGIILKGLLSSYSTIKSISISSVFFSLVHINFVNFNYLQVLLALNIGFFLGWIYYRSNNLILCIILHGLTNFFGMFYDYLYYSLILGKHVIQKSSTYLLFIPLLISVVLIVFLILQVKNKTAKYIE